MSGSGASNLGYGKIIPNSNVNPNFVNVGSTSYAGNFGSNEIPGPPNLPGLVSAKNNVDAAAGILYKGKGGAGSRGTKLFKRKIKNITKQYKMNKKSLKKRASTLRRKIKRHVSKGSKNGSRSRRYRQRGGYSQYQNNLPMTTTYSTGGYLKPQNLALANPVPYKVLSNCTNCVDNYNHYTNKGFNSKGH